MTRLAIDFGTSNTVVAEWHEAAQAPRTRRLPAIALPPADGLPSVVPSLLYAESAERALVGAEVRDAGLDFTGDPRFFAGFKRAIAADIEGFAPRLDGVEHTARLVGERFLRRVLASCGPVDEVVFTVPVQAFERYLHWLQGLAAAAGIAKVHVLDESTAAALGYQVLMPQALVLVCDFGGGTLDLSLVRTPDPGRAGVALRDGEAGRDRLAQVIAKAGQVLGGEDIDHWLVDDFLARHRLAPSEVEDDLAQLKQLAEQVKIRLSSDPSAALAYFSQIHAKTFQTTYSREDLESVLEAHDFYLKLQSALDALLRQAEARGVGRAQIEQVLLVGGTTLIPSVQRAIRQNFGAQKVQSHAPFEAVAHGALTLLKGLKLDDFLYHGYGVRYWDARQQRHRYEPILQPGHAYPSAEPVELVLRASRPTQPAIELVIGEFEANAGAEVVFDGRRLVSTTLEADHARVVPLNEGHAQLAPLEPPGFPGVDRLRARFRVDERRQLRLTIHDLATNRCLLDDVPLVELR